MFSLNESFLTPLYTDSLTLFVQ